MSEESEPEEQSMMARGEQEREEERRAGFEAMGRGPDTSSVEYALHAAREVLFSE